ncbi:MAG: hypothetical protein S4CHLAM2_13870 [Chlamydiales bacterium]|nr:hypothetical protein [Chlamydiales bacterium]
MQNSHRAIQCALKKALAPDLVWLEKPFPSINRVADVVWPAQNIIFEVQCSSISPKEIEARLHAYKQIGYDLIWILHDRRFNQKRESPAERFLRSYPHYFCTMNALGEGEIYDQYAHTRWAERIRRTPRYPITLYAPQHLKHIPPHYPKERQKWKIGFQGDLFQQPFQPLKCTPISLYRILFQILLEKVCS